METMAFALTQGRVGGNFGGTQLSRHDIALAPVNYPHEYAHDYLSSTHKDEPESKVGNFVLDFPIVALAGLLILEEICIRVGRWAGDLITRGRRSYGDGLILLAAQRGYSGPGLIFNGNPFAF